MITGKLAVSVKNRLATAARKKAVKSVVYEAVEELGVGEDLEEAPVQEEVLGGSGGG